MLILMLIVSFCLQETGQQENGRQETVAQKKEVTAEDVIQRYIQARGGRKNLEKIKSCLTESDVFFNGKKIGSAHSKFIEGGYYTEDRFLDGRSRFSGCDSKTAWKIDPEGNAKILTGKEANGFIENNRDLHSSLHWKRDFKSIRLVGQKTMGKQETYHLVFTAKDGRTIDRFFRKSDGLLIGERQEILGPVKYQMESRIGGYKKGIYGIVVSHSRTNKMSAPDGTTYHVEFQVTKRKFNSVKKEDVEFPESVKLLLKKSKAKLKQEG